MSTNASQNKNYESQLRGRSETSVHVTYNQVNGHGALNHLDGSVCDAE